MSASFDSAELIQKNQNANDGDIPLAVFIEDVESFASDRDPMMIHSALKELLSKYNFMFESFLAQKRVMLRKMPDIQQAIEVVDFLRRRNKTGDTIETHFPLTDNCHARATIPPTDKVCLWLGANVMLEYPIGEAEALLCSSNTNATDSIKKLDKNLAYLRDQITTTEVNIARIHNHMVKVKAQLRAMESSSVPQTVTA